jgi:hypothetical protein
VRHDIRFQVFEARLSTRPRKASALQRFRPESMGQLTFG